MEENTAVSTGHKRRNSIPAAVILPTSLHNGGHHNHNHHHYFYQHHRSHQFSPSPSPASLAVSDFELVAFKSPDDSYTSLKDLIPTSSTSGASILSPPPHSATTSVTSAISNASSGGSGYEISIRNRLVKQAAWAYLQPTIASSPSSSRRFFFFFSGEFLRQFFADFRRVVVESVTRGYDWLVDALWLILCR